MMMVISSASVRNVSKFTLGKAKMEPKT